MAKYVQVLVFDVADVDDYAEKNPSIDKRDFADFAARAPFVLSECLGMDPDYIRVEKMGAVALPADTTPQTLLDAAALTPSISLKRFRP